MTDLEGSLECSYGGYVFSVYAETIGLDVRMIYDSAGRTVTHKIATVTIRDWLADSNNGAGDQMDEVRRSLERPGGDFVYEDSGFGLFTFGQGGLAKTDLKWGPKPKVISCKPKGGGNAVEFTWQVEVAFLDTENAAERNAIMEFNYKLTFTYDRSGYCTRTYTGHLIIPMTRGGAEDRGINDDIEKHRDKVWPRQPKDFRRIPGTFTFSEDKCRMDFTITDEEMPPNMPPRCVVDWTCDHRIESDQGNLNMFNGTISADYELMKHFAGKRVGGLDVAPHFFALVKDRLAETATKAEHHSYDCDVIAQTGNRRTTIKGTNTKKDAIAKVTKGTVIIPTRFGFSEPSIAGKTHAQFSLGYRFACHISSVIAASGMWRPVPGTNWQEWSTSLLSVINPRGACGMQFSPADDAIVDLCPGGQAIKLPGGAAKGAGFALPQGLLEIMNAGKSDMKPEDSWVKYAAQVQLEVLDEVAELKLLPPEQVTQQQAQRKMTEVAGAQLSYGAAGGAHSVLQQRAAPTVIVHYKGSALRAAYEIIAPTLKSVLGVTNLVEANLPGMGVLTGVVANLGVPIMGAKWHRRYILPRVPAEKLVGPVNPVLEPQSQ